MTYLLLTLLLIELKPTFYKIFIMCLNNIYRQRNKIYHKKSLSFVETLYNTARVIGGLARNIDVNI